MGLYGIDCPTCGKPHLWFSGNLDTRCGECQKKDGELTDQFLDQVDKQVNQTLLPCGHKPCSLGYCKNCENHCTSGIKPRGDKK